MAADTSRAALDGPTLRRAIRAAVAKHLDLTRYDVFLFGSEAAGTAHARASDIDIGIKGPDALPGATLQRIRDELEGLRTLRAIDVVDFGMVDESFRREAMTHVERL